MSVRSVLIVLNALALAGLAAYGVLALRRTPEVREPPNLTPFFDDDDLEGRRLERALGWALLCAAVVAVSLPLYWLREPDRQKEAAAYFDDRAVERGDVLYANKTSEVYNSATSLQCANCHGAKGEGGSANTTYKTPEGTVIRVTWRAPALDTVLLRFTEDELRQIITYGRPGTPMQPWGVAGGGSKNEQSVDDLVAFIGSIQLDPSTAQQQAADALAAAKTQARDALAAADQALADARKKLADTRKDPEATDAAVAGAEKGVDDARQALAWARDWLSRRQEVSDGQLLFELNCARCHTKAWSIFDPTRTRPEDIGLGLAGGGGAQGFNLRDGNSERRFGLGDDGAASEGEFVRAGSEANKPYGIGGVGSGRMPGFSGMLTDEQITAIVDYDRSGLDTTDYNATATATGGNQ